LGRWENKCLGAGIAIKTSKYLIKRVALGIRCQRLGPGAIPQPSIARRYGGEPSLLLFLQKITICVRIKFLLLNTLLNCKIYSNNS